MLLQRYQENMSSVCRRSLHQDRQEDSLPVLKRKYGLDTGVTELRVYVLTYQVSSLLYQSGLVVSDSCSGVKPSETFLFLSKSTMCPAFLTVIALQIQDELPPEATCLPAMMVSSQKPEAPHPETNEWRGPCICEACVR